MKYLPDGPAAFLETFIKHYIACALWSTTNEGPGSISENLDGQYDRTDLEAQTYLEMTSDCCAFILKMIEELSDKELEALDAGQCGHDFWLTRNGHGAGFWDRDNLEENKLGERLTALCKTFPEYNLIGDGTCVSRL